MSQVLSLFSSLPSLRLFAVTFEIEENALVLLGVTDSKLCHAGGVACDIIIKRGHVLSVDNLV